MAQNGPNDHFGQNDLILNWILAFARPKWTILVHFGLKRSILVHLGPPTVLWPFLTGTHRQTRKLPWRKSPPGAVSDTCPTSIKCEGPPECALHLLCQPRRQFSGWLRNRTGTGNRNRRNRFSGVNKSARERISRQNFVPESPLQKGVFGSHIFSKRVHTKRVMQPHAS